MNRIVRLFAHTESAQAAQLRAELATYTSEADLADLYAILDRYPAEQTAQIRTILGDNHLQAA